MGEKPEQYLGGLDVFVGGPIQHAIRPVGFLPSLQESISTAIGQIRANGGNVFSAHVVEEFGDKTAAFTPEQVSLRDFRWMKKCDVFVPFLPVGEDGTLLRTDGTHIELGWATALGRPIVLVTSLPINNSASHLLKGLHMVGSVTVLDLELVLKEPEFLINGILSATGRQREAILASAIS
ncbi:nucleoside 2-deoxyribosyltransferase [Micromonospora cathayae]|uniref:Nucleoside 2-deoxyribosyltransferase n=1 Tax=Micromonospora cathayae TaxID=3028804 RepID=A0ABY7ZTC4_9ACTN|nr:nucleoside 2-deoxyribosyltransferase [Micromonospora sp. HUAS 3]WDZ85074.1 nucleoside 2-deoxyribosyltransferase [Micromonospora sp. HUAS 3]